MTINKKWLRKHCNKMRYCITQEQERYILSLFENEPDGHHVWNEQDIYEQIRKILNSEENVSSENKAVRYE